ncbi:hypothetical protein C4D60_Mb06t17770 [Musa balbisiana]|uniref:Lactate/malate dehydrogenase N-terminal domain-containing protein n=1 Tax=Musa balbisiana TaxID=52838 RepID=A0A4S8IQ28_MUSBA|nr:hypothetical protein C4D60_Mb06t17770 [Musa balbisiana]
MAVAVAVALRNVARWPPAVASTAAPRPRTFPFSANTNRFSANFIVPIVYPPLFAEPRPVLRLARAVGGFDQVGGTGNQSSEDSVSQKAPTWAEPLLDFVATNFLPLALLSGIALGLVNPTPGCLAHKLSLSGFSTCGIFFISGIMLHSRELGAAVEAWPAGLFGLGSILLITPFFSRLVLQIQLAPHELITGLAAFCCMPTTLSSGVALTQLVGGNSALALAMTVLSNLLGILIVPFSLSKLIGAGAGISVPTAQLFKSLIMMLLVPLVIGKVIRDSSKSVAEYVDRNRRSFSMISAILLGLMKKVLSLSEPGFADDIHRTLFCPIQQATSPTQCHNKISMIGAGNVGMVIAQMILTDDLALADAKPDKLQGRCWTRSTPWPFSHAPGYAVTMNSDICIITTDTWQIPRETQPNLLQHNLALFKEIVSLLARYSPRMLLLLRERGQETTAGREEWSWMRATTELSWERWRTCSTLGVRVEKKGRTRGEAKGVPWMQVSRSRSLLLTVKPAIFAIAVGMGIFLHFILLAFNTIAVRSLSVVSGGDQSVFSKKENLRAVIIVASQKTLPVLVAVVEQLQGALGEAGLLVLPCVALHINQIIIDSFLVNWWLRRDQISAKSKEV